MFPLFFKFLPIWTLLAVYHSYGHFLQCTTVMDTSCSVPELLTLTSGGGSLYVACFTGTLEGADGVGTDGRVGTPQ